MILKFMSGFSKVNLKVSQAMLQKIIKWTKKSRKGNKNGRIHLSL